MSYRYTWQDIKDSELLTRWNEGDYRYFLTCLKQNKSFKPNHPLFEGNVDGRGIKLKKTRLAKLNIEHGDFTYGQFYSNGLTNSRFENCLFISANFSVSNLTQSTFSGCSFVGSSFRRANFTEAEFHHCDFTGADFTMANFKGARFHHCTLDGATMWQGFYLDQLSGSHFSAANLEIDRASFEAISVPALQQVIKKMGRISDHEYDVAISFAGEDRAAAEKIAAGLTKRDVRVFYDDYEKVDLWGRNLYDHLSDVYQYKARYCLMIISKHYAAKLWTNLERQSAQARAFQENEAYILPLRIDDTEVKGILPTVSYLRYHDYPLKELITLIKKKLGYIPR